MVPTVVLGLGKGSVPKPDTTTAQSPPSGQAPTRPGPGFGTRSAPASSSPTTPVTNGQINNNNKYKLTTSSIPEIIRNTNNTAITTTRENHNKVITTGGPDGKLITSQKSKVLTLSGNNLNSHTPQLVTTTANTGEWVFFKSPLFFLVKPQHVYSVYVLVGLKSTCTQSVHTKWGRIMTSMKCVCIQNSNKKELYVLFFIMKSPLRNKSYKNAKMKNWKKISSFHPHSAQSCASLNHQRILEK